MPVETTEIPPLVAAPLAAGLCTWKDVNTDGENFCLDSMWKLNEMLLVRAENERRAHDAATKKQQRRLG